MSTVIVLNAPAGAGKDTLAEALEELDLQRMSFKDVLFERVLERITSPDLYAEFRERAEDRDLKDQYWEVIKCSPREYLIHLSEEILKPTLGEACIGKLSAKSAAEYADVGIDVVYSDGGFEPEIQALADEGLEVHVVRLRRDGFSFDGDSRNYIKTGDDWTTHDVLIFDDQIQKAVHDIIQRVYHD